MIKLQLPFLPISVNDMYQDLAVKVMGRTRVKRVLSADGRKFKKEAIAHLAENYPMELATLKPNKPYAVAIVCVVEALENEGWKKGRTDRYKTYDVDNRAKAMLDVLVEASAVDDKHHIGALTAKRPCKPGEPPNVELYVWSLEDEDVQFDSIMQQCVRRV